MPPAESPQSAIISKLRAAMPGLRTRYGVTALSLFGSAARGDATPDSDIDLLASFDPGATVTLLTFGRLQTELQLLLGRPVDIVEDHRALRPAFRRELQRDALRVA